MSSSRRSYRRHYPDIATMTHCECKPPLLIKVQVAWTRINPGRRFKCFTVYEINQQCGVYGFLDYELPFEYYKELLYKEHVDNQSLKRRNTQAYVHGSGYQQKDRKPSQNDKTEHGMEKTVQNQGQSPKMPKSESIQKNQQSNRSRN
ncbi:hypothetical protein Tco_0708644 [Tanacetum coccineum]